MDSVGGARLPTSTRSLRWPIDRNQRAVFSRRPSDAIRAVHLRTGSLAATADTRVPRPQPSAVSAIIRDETRLDVSPADCDSAGAVDDAKPSAGRGGDSVIGYRPTLRLFRTRWGGSDINGIHGSGGHRGSGGSGGGRGGRCHNGSSSDDDSHGSFDEPGRAYTFASWLLGGGLVARALGLDLTPPAAAAAATAAGDAPTTLVGSASSAAAVPAVVTESAGGGPSAGGDGGAAAAAAKAAPASYGIDADPSPQQRLKRLMREAFAELTELRVRLEALEAKGAAEAEAAAAGEAWVVPLEGFAVRPISRALAPGMRLRCGAQVSGTLDVPVLVTVASAEGMVGATSGADVGSSSGGHEADGGSDIPPRADPSWRGLIEEAGFGMAPRLRLRIQSVWGTGGGAGGEAGPYAAPGGSSSSSSGGGGGGSAANAAAVLQPRLARKAGSPGAEGAGAGLEEEREADMPVAAHLQVSTAEGSRHLELDKLLLKVEAHPRLRLLLATHGSLENIAKNVNPYAAGVGLHRGLTEPMRRGHDLTLLSAGGLGAAAVASVGDLSLAVGAFARSPSLGEGNPVGAARQGPPRARSLSTSAVASSTTCAQLSLHRSRRLALSALWSSAASTAAAEAPLTQQDLGHLGGSRSDGDQGAAVSGRIVQRGVVAAAQLTDQLTAAAWVGNASPCQPHGAAGAYGGEEGPLGPWADAGPTQQPRERRVGMRLSTLPDQDTGRSYALSVSHRRRLEGGSLRHATLVAEASAALPVAHGVMLTPGLVLLHGSGGAGGSARGGSSRTLLLAAAQTTWSF